MLIEIHKLYLHTSLIQYVMADERYDYLHQKPRYKYCLVV